MQARGVGLAHVGRRRENNEDCWLADDQLGLYAVADGMGGYRGGEVAANAALVAAAKAIRGQRDLLLKVRDGTARSKELEGVVRRAITDANEAVLALSGSRPEAERMGCTLTLLLVAGARGVMGHVGDSRLYLCREGKLHQLSRDHTLAAELAREGVIEPEEVKGHPYGHALTQAVGRRRLKPDVLRFELCPRDRALLCSDGLTAYAKDPEWLGARLAEDDLDGIPRELVGFANAAGGGDNITALVVGVDPEPSEERQQAAEELRARLSAVEGFFLCAGLSFARQALVISHCELRTHEADELVVVEGGPLEGCTLLAEGSLEVRRGERSAGRLRPGQACGARALLGARVARAEVVARERSRTLTLTAEGMRALARARPGLGVLLLRRLATHLCQALDPRLEADPRAPATLIP